MSRGRGWGGGAQLGQWKCRWGNKWDWKCRTGNTNGTVEVQQDEKHNWDRGSAEVRENVTRAMEELEGENTTEAVKVQQDGRAQLGQRKCSRVETQP